LNKKKLAGKKAYQQKKNFFVQEYEGDSMVQESILSFLL